MNRDDFLFLLGVGVFLTLFVPVVLLEVALVREIADLLNIEICDGRVCGDG